MVEGSGFAWLLSRWCVLSYVHLHQVLSEKILHLAGWYAYCSLSFQTCKLPPKFFVSKMQMCSKNNYD